MKIVVRAPNWVGDCVLSLPFFHLLRQKYPRAEVTVIAKKPGVEVFSGITVIDHVWPYEGLWKTGRRLRAERFDVGYILPNSISSAVLFLVGGVHQRIGYSTEGRRLLLTQGVKWKGEVEHRSVRYARLAQPDLVPTAIHPRSHPAAIMIDTLADEEADRLLDGIDRSRLVAINPCANAPSRRWAADRYASVAREIVSKGGQVVLVGGPAPDDRARVAEVLKDCRVPGVHDLSGKTTVRGLAAVLSRCKLLVTGDTGIMHVGAAAGVPLLALEGAADVAVTAPWSAGTFIPIDKSVACSPCVKNHCFNRKTPMVCMTSIEAREVADQALKMLR